MPAVEHYKSERGLMEVLCNLSGSYRPVEDVASRISLAMQMVYTYIIRLFCDHLYLILHTCIYTVYVRCMYIHVFK